MKALLFCLTILTFVANAQAASPLNNITDPLSPNGNPYIAPFGDSYLETLMNDPTKAEKGVAEVTSPTGSTHKVNLPVRYWEVSGLGLYGLVDFKKAEAALKAEATKWGAPLRQPFRVPNTDFAMVYIYSANLNGTDVGAVKDYFVNIVLEPNQAEKDVKAAFVIYTWFFYQNGYLNHLWKNNYWGIDTRLGMVKYTFEESVKEATLALPNKTGPPTELMRMKWNIGKMLKRPAAVKFNEVVGVFVSHRKRVFAPFYFSGERYWDENDSATGLSTFDATRGDEFYVNPNTDMGKALKDLGFVPTQWVFNSNYSGLINFPSQTVY